MNSMKLTKRALLSSVVALTLCFVMLLGTTYAWFTDSVTSSGNIIQTGKLDVTLEYKAPTDTEWQDASQGAIFNYSYWEPGYTEVRYVKIENKGTLDLQYVLTIVPNQTDAEVDLAEVIDVYMFDGEKTDVSRSDLAAATPVGTIADLIADKDGAAYGTLDADPAGNESQVYTIVLKMQETAGNEYQGLSLGGGFSVNLLATQLESETDAFGPDYDAEATLPAIVGSGSVAVGTPDVLGTYTIKALNANTTDSQTTVFVATLVVKEKSVATDAKNINVVVIEDVPQAQSDLGIEVEGVVKTYDITVEGLVEGNTEPVEVYLYVGAGKNIGNVVYHTLANGIVEEIPCTYDSNTGNVRFKTTSFSPFSVVEYDEPFVPSDTDVPQSSLTELETILPEYTDWLLTTGNYANIIDFVSPETLDVFYSFKASDTEETVADSIYADWKCDFFVKVNKTIPANSIILGGYYDEIGAVAFTNSVEVEGEMWIPLLLLVSNGWTYEDIVCGVGEFVCGVKDVESGYCKTEEIEFTVQLRLVDPEAVANDDSKEKVLNLQPEDYIVVNEVVYDFTTGNSTIVK